MIVVWTVGKIFTCDVCEFNKTFKIGTQLQGWSLLYPLWSRVPTVSVTFSLDASNSVEAFSFMLWPIMKMTHVLKTDLWWVRLTALVRRVWLKTLKICLNVKLALCQTHCRQVPQVLPMGQYGLCLGYLVSGPLPLRSHKGQVTFIRGHFLGVPSLYTGQVWSLPVLWSCAKY